MAALGEGAVQVWAVEIDAWDDAWWRRACSLLPAGDVQRILLCRNPLEQRRKFIGRLLVRWRLSVLSGGTMKGVALAQGVQGKPYALGLPWSFSVSHSGCCIVAALAHEAVGIDVEERRPVSESVFRNALTPSEFAYVTAVAEERQRTDRFLTVWTRKESYFKALGTGLTGAWRTLPFAVDNAPRRQLGAWHFYDCPLHPDYVAVLCAQASAEPQLVTMTLTHWMRELDAAT
ncbi:MAG: 4'-phosphopantetheinyl transferase superfamily protein [Firmicutes bacterium]|nr:4'-phosphopantetheinyl transferase superfamily protein [Bacillota bacterium]